MTIVDIENKNKSVDHKKFFEMNDANIWIKSKEEEFLKPKYMFVRETY